MDWSARSWHVCGMFLSRYQANQIADSCFHIVLPRNPCYLTVIIHGSQRIRNNARMDFEPAVTWRDHPAFFFCARACFASCFIVVYERFWAMKRSIEWPDSLIEQLIDCLIARWIGLRVLGICAACFSSRHQAKQIAVLM